MYTKILNVQIIISLLKQHNVSHVVLSAGTRHVPLAHSIEEDPFFKCFSVVDERSAGYFALGLSKSINQPVAIACTSSTATCNYLPPIAEAFYQKIPLVVLTGDRDPILLNQLEDQMINQVDMYKNFCRKCVNLPVVSSDKDIWYCQRLVNEALLELNHHGSGPVQINFPINQSIEDIADNSIEELPVYNIINRIDPQSMPDMWLKSIEKLKNSNRILVVCGSSMPQTKEFEQYIDQFIDQFNCVVATEHLSNLHSKNAINTFLLAEAISDKVLGCPDPDIVIFFGGNFISRLKTQLRIIHKSFQSWLISDDGIVMDPFQNQKLILECTPLYFFKYCVEHAGGSKSNQIYSREIKEKLNLLKIPAPDQLTLPQSITTPSQDNAFSSMYALYIFSQKIPDRSLLHLSILNSTRIMSMFPLAPSIEVYSNVGTDGIDGSMSTFFGQMAGKNTNGYLVIGDLSFFYDMNSVSIRHIGKNVHILLINNGGGCEFYFSMGRKLLPKIDAHISASHENKAREWVCSNGFKYFEAHTRKELDETINDFINSPGPVFMEVFTHRESDAETIKAFRRRIRITSVDEKLKSTVKTLLDRSSVGQNIEKRLKSILMKKR